MSKRHRSHTPPDRATPRRHRTPFLLGAFIVFAGLAVWPLYRWRQSATETTATHPAAAAHTAVALLGGKIRFTNAAAQAREFVGYNSTIRLTEAQEAIKREVLGSMHAACCRDSNAYTCCCPCNLSKSVWGLSNYALATHGATADELRQVVRAWYEFTNPNGYSGDVCYTGGCDRSFHENGCGGMSESKIAA